MLLFQPLPLVKVFLKPNSHITGSHGQWLPVSKQGTWCPVTPLVAPLPQEGVTSDEAWIAVMSKLGSSFVYP